VDYGEGRGESRDFFIFQKIILYYEKFNHLILIDFIFWRKMKNNFEKIERAECVP
jgi:hypothetical protein